MNIMSRHILRMSSVEVVSHKNKNHRTVRTSDLHTLSVCVLVFGSAFVLEARRLQMTVSLSSVCVYPAVESAECVCASLFADMTTTKSVLTKACFSAAEPQSGSDVNRMSCMWSAVQIKVKI